LELREKAGREYLVGAAALQSKNVFSTRDIRFLIDYSPLLAFKAGEEIARAEGLDWNECLAAEKGLCIGIPLAHFHSKSPLLLQAVKDCRISNCRLGFDQAQLLPHDKAKNASGLRRAF